MIHSVNRDLYEEAKVLKDKKQPPTIKNSPKSQVVKIPDSIELSDAETFILQKGLTYVPETKITD